MDENTFAQLLESLRDGPPLIEAEVRRVPASAWDDRLFQGESGWTRRQLLAHIVANDQRQITRVRIGAGIGNDADTEAYEAQGDLDGWNQQQVDLRSERSIEDLLIEMHARRREFVALLESLTPEQRSRDMPFRGESRPLPAMVPFVLGHLTQHAAELTA